MDRIPSPREGLRDSPREGPRLEEMIRPDVHEALREEFRDDGRERMRQGNANVDPFQMPDIQARFPDIDFNWKRYEVYGRPDYAEQRMYHDQGWRPVQHAHFPGRFAPVGASGPVIVKDMILMHRPLRLTLQARREESEAANRAMQVHRLSMAETPAGQAPRMQPVIRSSREAIEIPED